MAKIYKAALIIIGNEILSGRTQDKNIQFLAQELTKIGIRLQEVRVISDDRDAIIKAVNELKVESDYVFTTGGIGPTHDDITSEAIAGACQVPLIQNPEALACLRAYYKDQELNEARLKMADIPKGAKLIPNTISSAPGFQIENIYVMAGIPNIMQAMFRVIAPELVGGDIIHSKEITVYIAESKIAQLMRQTQDKYVGVEIGSYPFSEGDRYGTHIVLRSANQEQLTQATHDIEKGLMSA